MTKLKLNDSGPEDPEDDEEEDEQEDEQEDNPEQSLERRRKDILPNVSTQGYVRK